MRKKHKKFFLKYCLQHKIKLDKEGYPLEGTSEFDYESDGKKRSDSTPLNTEE